MQLRIPPKRTFLIVILTSFAILAVLAGIFLLGLRNGAQSTPLAFAERGKSTPDVPEHLRIPAIGVDAAIEHLGLTPQRAMDAPKGAADVAWFDLGPHPGDVGSAVIAGHEGWKNNLPAVFDDLYKLQKGDKVYVEDANGTTTAFVVREIRIYKQDADTSEVFSSKDGKVHLNLITCKGVWNTAQKSYSDRLVVFTDIE